ncbi:transposase [Aeromicrobium sp.]|uniref:transposase n=1 Tax=Aeromicrobium sp. TaxID=1871063 RepID=UPI00199BE599|nr:transposase [Aeromicrobium sp.]MBC7630452.1 transposase [Aeromicrobium sp.]
MSNGPTEATNALIKKVKRAGHGFRNFDNYRLRLLLTVGLDWRTVHWLAAPASAMRGRSRRLVASSPQTTEGGRATQSCRADLMGSSGRNS